MKTDLATAIVTAILGIAVAFFVTNLFVPEFEDFSFKALESNGDYSLAEPDVNIFNYRALNPTVEVYVENCDVYDQNGECVVNDVSKILDVEEGL